MLRSAPRPEVSLTARAITKLFGDTVALWDVDLDARSSRILAVHGANGSGKSTLLAILAGVMTPTRGAVSWVADGEATKPRIGLLGHAGHLFEELTAIENIVLAARLSRGDEAAAIDLLGQLGVARWAAHRVGGLSAGTRRRVGLARVLATDPDVLIIDEPFAGLDRTAAALVGQMLAQVRDSGRVVVIATHDDARDRLSATTAVWLDAGRLRRPIRVGDPAVAR